VRIAIYEPEPRVCGPMTWAYHLQSGFQTLGHECHVVSSTKSGRERVAWGESRLGTRWWGVAPDVVCRNDELVDVLNGYDRVILSDVRTVAQDKEAKKADALPVYVDALLKTSTPWTSAFHGNAYPLSETPYLAQLLESPAWTGVLIDQTERATSIRKGSHLNGIPLMFSDLPYRLRNSVDAPPVANLNTVGMTGRFIFNKGHHVTALATPYLWEGVNVELWGSCSVGLGPNPTYIVWEALRKIAGVDPGVPSELFVRHGNVPESPDGGNIIQPFHWEGHFDGDRTVRYLGNYMNQLEVASRIGIHVNLTTAAFSAGNVEYASLEAMDAGCLPMAQEALAGRSYRMRVLPNIASWPGVGKLQSDPTTVKWLAEIITQTRDAAAANPDWHREVAQHNREVVSMYNDPARAATRFLEALKAN
jgi:hypothetical protein